MKAFPLYRSHSEAGCFNCGGDFGDGWWTRTQSAHGKGAFVQTCDRCFHSTLYDIGCRHADYSADREGRCSGCGEYVTHADWKHRGVA